MSTQRLRAAVDDVAAADAIHLSLPHFKKVFKQEIGALPYEYLLQRKIDRAKTLLKESDTSITDVAMQLCFASSQHFATSFKKQRSTSDR